ncbi:MAG: hypothetical protein Q7J32_16105 [Sphingomonadaceae bacterium]|nr:hypothetical protein [Sphingomonadaceae bacterium]
MNSTLLPHGATTMLEIIAATTLVAAGFAIWLWRQHRRLQQPIPPQGASRSR